MASRVEKKDKEKFVFNVDDDILISSVSHNRMSMFHARGGVISPSMPIPITAVAPTTVPKQRAITAAAASSRPKRSEPLVVDEYEALTEPTPTVEAQVPETTHGTEEPALAPTEPHVIRAEVPAGTLAADDPDQVLIQSKS